MQLEVGKYYKTRDGRRVKVIEDDGGKSDPILVRHNDWILWHKRDGTCNICDASLDIIAEWTDEPAQLTAIDHLRKAAELFLAAGNDKAAFDVLGVVLDHE